LIRSGIVNIYLLHFHKPKTAKIFFFRKLKRNFFSKPRPTWHDGSSSWHVLRVALTWFATGMFVARTLSKRGTFAGRTMNVARWDYERGTFLPRTMIVPRFAESWHVSYKLIRGTKITQRGTSTLCLYKHASQTFHNFHFPLPKLCPNFALIVFILSNSFLTLHSSSQSPLYTT
jgi:hypothetical protein